MKKILILVVIVCGLGIYLFQNYSLVKKDKKNEINEAHKAWISKVLKNHAGLVRRDAFREDGAFVTFGPIGIEPMDKDVEEILAFTETEFFYQFHKKEVVLYLYEKYNRKEDAYLVYPAILDKINDYGLYEGALSPQEKNEAIIKRVKADYSIP